MLEQTKKPAIRFKGFTETWEQRKLGELALFNPKDELPQTFEYVDLESVVGTEMLSHRAEVKSSAPSRAQRLAHTGDLFYQTVRPYQKNNYLFEKPDNNYVFSTGYAQMRPYVDGYFLLSLVQSERFVKVVLDNCTGTSYPAINANDLAEIEVAAPSDESEAQKIGTIFRSIDNLITLHQRKYDKLVCVKKSMLEKMFPKNGSSRPEIRFSGFTEAWEQRKLESLFNKGGSGGTPSSTNPNYYNGSIPFLSITDISNSDGYIYDTEKHITELGLSNSTAWIVQKEAIALAMYASVGKVAILKEDAATSQAFYNMIFDSNITRNYIYEYLKKMESNNEWLRNISTGTQANLNAEKVKNLVISIPSNMAEQDAIGRFLIAMDNLITLHQRELEKLKNIKKSCLEKMFV